MAAPRKCLSYALNRLLISNIYLSYATPGGTNKAQLLGDINSILFQGIFGCRRAQMLTVPKLPERKSFQQLLMSVQSCLTCYELPAAVKQQKQQSNSNSNNNKTSMGNQKYIFVMASAISLHSKLLLQLLFVFPWRILMLLQGKSCASFSWQHIYIFIFHRKIHRQRSL